MSFTVYPSVDISEGRCVRPLHGRFGSHAVYSDDPVAIALGLAAAGARWLHIVDLDGARSGIPSNREVVLEVVRRSSCPVQAGGAVVTADDVEEMLAAGANRAVVGARALDDEVELARTCSRFGERVAASLDARGSESDPQGWTVGSGVPVLDAVGLFEKAGVSAFVFTDLTRDGTMGGVNVGALHRITETTRLPLIAAGGIGSLAELRDVARLHRQGVAGAVVGRALYDNKFTVGQANYEADEAATGRDEETLAEGV